MNNKLKILMVSDSFLPIVGGREQVIHHLMSQYLNNANATLLTSQLGLRSNNEYDSSLPYNIIRCKSLKITKNEYLSIIDKKTKKQIEQLCRNGVDVIHTQTKYSLCSYAIKLGKKYNIPVVTTCHTLYPLIYKIQLKSRLLKQIFLSHVKKVINKTDGVITVSEFMKNTLLKMGITVPIEVIPNGNDMVQYKDLDFDENEIKTKYGVSNTENIFCFVGRINPVKNIECLLQVLSNLKKYGVNFKTLLVGNGKIKFYKKQAKKLNLENEVIFTGAIKDREELAKLYKISDLHLLFSQTETFGLNVREAGIMGTPTIAIENTASSEPIIHERNGFVSDLNIENLTKLIMHAITNKDNLKVIGENSKTSSSTTWKEISDLHINYYKKLINKKNS